MDAEQEHGHDAEGGAEKGEHGPPDHGADKAAVAVVGEQPGAGGEGPVFQGGGDTVQAPRQAPQHRQQADHFVGGSVTQRGGGHQVTEP